MNRLQSRLTALTLTLMGAGAVAAFPMDNGDAGKAGWLRGTWTGRNDTFKISATFGPNGVFNHWIHNDACDVELNGTYTVVRTGETSVDVRLSSPKLIRSTGNRPVCERRMANEGLFREYVTLTLQVRESVPTLDAWNAALVKYSPKPGDDSGDMRRRIDTVIGNLPTRR